MAQKPSFDLSELRDRLRYDAETGHLYWVAPKSNRLRPGQRAGCKMVNGYQKIALYQEQMYIHHIVWYLTHGEWPTEMIDHINGDRSDNRVENLRLANQSQQNFNMGLRESNKTGVTGVAICSKTGRFRAYLTLGRKQIYLGNHVTLDAAVAARKEAEAKYCGEFRRVSPQHVQEPAL